VAARAFASNAQTSRLLPIGGVARISACPTNRAELVVAIAGPLVNVVIAAVLVFVLDRTPSSNTSNV